MRSGAGPLLSVEEAKSKVMDLAIQLYRDGKVGLSKAAEIAGLSIAEFEDQLIKRGVGVTIYARDDLSIFKSEVENIREIVRRSRKS
jgi:predicted HTH domain antitoxin